MSINDNRILKDKTFDKSRWIQLPRDVIAGHDALKQLPLVVSDLGMKRYIPGLSLWKLLTIQ